MPLHDYECLKCHRTSELLVSTSRQPVCPHCGSKKMEKQLSAFALKGDKGGKHVHSAACGCHHGHGRCCGGGHCGA